MTALKKSIENFNSRLNQAKDRINEHKTGQLKLPRQRKKKKRVKKSAKSLQDFTGISSKETIYTYGHPKRSRER